MENFVKKSRKDKLILILILLVAITVYGQETENVSIDLNKVVPENPNVASLMKAARTPVTEYAGLPNVQIPIYQINQRSLKVPISLSYHTGGIKVGEESGSVGLGWALNAGGVIHRTINGYPDFNEHQKGNQYYQNIAPIPDPVISTNPINNESYFNLDQNAFIRSDDSCQFIVDGNPQVFNYLYETDDNIPDNLPDMYSFNFNGYSGQFVMKKDGSIYKLDKNNNYIQWQFVENSGSDYSFSITTEDGTKHFFEYYGKTWPKAAESVHHISTWYLTKSVSATNDVILYEYEKDNITGGINGTHSYPLKSFVQALYFNEGQGGPTDFINSSGPQTEIDDVYLTKIVFGKGELVNGEMTVSSIKKGEIVLNYSNPGVRLDIPNAFYLSNIQVLDFNSNLVEQHDFYYSYFGDPNASQGTMISGDYVEITGHNSLDNPHLNLRLRLDSISSNGKMHGFTYNDANIIPNKTSMSQDYWGFYNGFQNSETFIGFGSSSFGSLPDDYKAKRYPVANKAKLFSLKRITYPTKGYTEFDFESNTYNMLYTSIPNQISPPPATVPKSESVQTFGGGQVVSKIIEPQGVNTVIRINLAIYSTNVSKTCGTGQYEFCDNSVPNLSNHPFDFGSDMYVKYTNNTSGETFTRYFYISDAMDQFQASGTAFQSVELDIGTPYTTNGYTFEVYFNDYGGLYSGRASAVVEWDEVEVGGSNNGDPGRFALGGGLRIKSITDYDYTNIPLSKRTFDYHYQDIIAGTPVERSYGLLKEVPKSNLDSPLYPFFTGAGYNIAASLVGRAYSQNGYSKDFGSYVGYDQVTVTFEDRFGQDNGKMVSKFYNYQDFQISDNIGIPFFPSMHQFPQIRLPHNGIMHQQKNYKRNEDGSYTLISDRNLDYTINKEVDADNFDYQEMFRTADYLLTAKYQFTTPDPVTHDPTDPTPCLQQTFQFHPLYVNLVELSSESLITFDLNGENPVTTVQNYYYESPYHFNLTTKESKKSDGKTMVTKTRYPDDFINGSTLHDNMSIPGGGLSNYQPIENLKSKNSDLSSNLNRVSEAIQVETYEMVNTVETLQSIQRNNFKIDDTGFVLPDFVEASKKSSNLESRVNYHRYDDNGNPIEVSKTDGMHICYVWGYNSIYPIAKIENVTYETGQPNTITSIQLTLIANAIAATVDETSNSTENTLRTELQLLRDGFPQAMVTTYTYDPLIGVTSITDPKGYTTYYEYDQYNRLKSVRDANGNKVTDYDYQYKSAQ